MTLRFVILSITAVSSPASNTGAEQIWLAQAKAAAQETRLAADWSMSEFQGNISADHE